MKYALDTNICIVCLTGRSQRLLVRLRSHSLRELTVCSVVRAELFYGAMKSSNPSRNLRAQQDFLTSFGKAEFDDRAALIFGEIRAELERQGTPIGPYDMQIAAIAMANDLTLVTHNVREFSRIKGLKWADWEA